MLEVHDLHVRFGGIDALRGVSLRAGPGQIVAVLGRNGAGKSTLLRTVSGLVHPWRGSVKWEGRPISGVPAGSITRMGIVHVPEGRRILAELSVRENLMLGGYGRRRERDARIEQTLELFPVLRGRRCRAGSSRCWRSAGRSWRGHTC
jgi:branched-chain amino acid transport system ATP-binding protein